jgi:hypothetical protein
MTLHQTITRTVDGTRYTVNHGSIALIAARRENARGASPRDHVMILTGLRNEIADRMGIDRRTASRLLATITYGQLFTR